MAFVHRRPNVFAVGLAVYRCCGSVLCLLGQQALPQARVTGPLMVQRWTTVCDAVPALIRVLVGVLCFLEGKHDTLGKCWVDVGPSSATLARHQPIIGSVSLVC